MSHADPPRVRVVQGVCKCKMKRGDAMRVPRALAVPVVGYFVSCPVCGLVDQHPSKLIDAETGVVVEEITQPGATIAEVRSMSPMVCSVFGCRSKFEVRDGAFVVLERGVPRMARSA